jgi:hypothetical protein
MGYLQKIIHELLQPKNYIRILLPKHDYVNERDEGVFILITAILVALNYLIFALLSVFLAIYKNNKYEHHNI